MQEEVQSNLEEVSSIEELLKRPEFKKAFFKVLKIHFWEEDKTNIIKYYNILDKRLKWNFVSWDETREFWELLYLNKEFKKDLKKFIKSVYWLNIELIEKLSSKPHDFDKLRNKICDIVTKKSLEISNNKTSAYLSDHEKYNSKEDYVEVNWENYYKLHIVIDWVEKYCYKKENSINEIKFEEFIFDEIDIKKIGDEVIVIWTVWGKRWLMKYWEEYDNNNFVFDWIWTDNWGYCIVEYENNIYYVAQKEWKESIIKYWDENIWVFDEVQKTDLKFIDNELYYLWKIDLEKNKEDEWWEGKTYKEKIYKYSDNKGNISNDSNDNFFEFKSWLITTHENKIINWKAFCVIWDSINNKTYFLAFWDDKSKIIESPNYENIKNIEILNWKTYILINENGKKWYINYKTWEKIFVENDNEDKWFKLKEDEEWVYLLDLEIKEIKKYFNNDNS